MNNNMILLFIICAFFIYFVIKIVTAKRTEEVKRAFAGKPDGNGPTVAVSKDRNKTIFTEGEKVVDLSGYDKFIVSGPSLEKVGLHNGSYIYTKELKDDEPIESICNHFVVFEFDKDRFKIEHPEIKDPVDGYKVRKVIALLPTQLTEEEFIKKISEYLDKDNEIDNKIQCVDCLTKKYKFASDYYKDKDEDELIISITYRNGEEKDYSFHSKEFLRGVVKYKSVN